MRILIFSRPFPPDVGGIQSHVYNLSRALSRLGHEVRVVALRGQGGLPIREQLGEVQVTRIPLVPLPKTMMLQYLGLAAAYLFWLAHRWKPAILHCHSFWPDLLVTKHMPDFVKVVHTAHESLFLIMAEQPRYHRRLRFILSHLDGLIGPSMELVEVARQFGIPAERSTFIPNGVDPGAFSPQIQKTGVCQRYGLSEQAPVVLCPRRLVPKNGVNYLIESLPLIMQSGEKVHFLVAGDGPEREKLKRRTRELQVEPSVHFLGSIPNQEMPHFYAAADLVVLPSLKEATSIAALEAMASSRPVVASNVGGLPYIIEHEKSGLLVPPADPAVLAGAILRLLDAPGLRQALGHAARRRVEEKFTWDHIASETVQVYERMIRGRQE